MIRTIRVDQMEDVWMVFFSFINNLHRNSTKTPSIFCWRWFILKVISKEQAPITTRWRSLSIKVLCSPIFMRSAMLMNLSKVWNNICRGAILIRSYRSKPEIYALKYGQLLTINNPFKFRSRYYSTV